MILTSKESLVIFALYFALGVILAIVCKVLLMLLTKAINILFPYKENSKIKINKQLIVNILVATLIFAIFLTLFIFIAIEFNYGQFRLFMLIASLLGFYLMFKIFSCKFIKFKAKTKKTS